MLRAPFTARTVKEILFCLSGVVLALLVLIPGVPLAVLTFLSLVPGLGRRFGRVHRALAARLLDAPIPDGDRRGWRSAAYALVKLPLAIPEAYAVVCGVGGAVNMTYPLWWPLFRNHPPGTRLAAVPVVTPFGSFDIGAYLGAVLAAAVGFAMLLAAPWVARVATGLDLAAMRALLGPGQAEQLRQLRESRARAVEDTATLARRLERDLHDGTQIRLATLAMNLGMASEKLGADGPAPDLIQARELVDAARRGATDALAELRNLVRGLHPPVLDNGLPDALETLASGCPLPVTVHTGLAERLAPAIETIAYFSVAELLANAVKHSDASHVWIDVASPGDRLSIEVRDDGVGGARPGTGTGLAGLADRIGTVDGRIDIASPPGGPTRVTIELPVTV
jgi:signal transduction histidine kinase